MPFYEYQCSACGRHTEVLQKISDAPLRKCPECGKQALKRLISAPVFRLKGGGWYETDFKSDSEQKRNLAGREEGESKSEDTKDESKNESKDEAKKEPAKETPATPSPKEPAAKPSTAKATAKSVAKPAKAKSHAKTTAKKASKRR